MHPNITALKRAHIHVVTLTVIPGHTSVRVPHCVPSPVEWVNTRVLWPSCLTSVTWLKYNGSYFSISAVWEWSGDRVVVHVIHLALLWVNLQADTEQCRSNYSGSAHFNCIRNFFGKEKWFCFADTAINIITQFKEIYDYDNTTV